MRKDVWNGLRLRLSRDKDPATQQETQVTAEMEDVPKRMNWPIS